MSTKPCPFCGLVDNHTDQCYFTLKLEGATIGELQQAWDRRAAPSQRTASAKAQVAPATNLPGLPDARAEFREWYCTTFNYRPQDMSDEYMLGTTAWKAWCEATRRAKAQEGSTT